MKPQNQITSIQNMSNRDAALLKLGGFHTIDRLTRALDSEMMRTLEAFQEEKLHEVLGFKTFAEFLDKSDISPMTRHQYYERKKSLDAHGDQVFDLLSGLSFPVSKQKTLGAGSVSLDGDNVVIRSEESATTINLKDKTAIAEALSALADANAEKAKKLKHGEADYDALRKRYYELEEKGESADRKQTPLDRIHASAVAAVAALADAIRKAPPTAAAFYLNNDLELLASQVQRVNDELVTKADAAEAQNDGSELDAAAALLDEED